jgi:hypothetical protein
MLVKSLLSFFENVGLAIRLNKTINPNTSRIIAPDLSPFFHLSKIENGKMQSHII